MTSPTSVCRDENTRREPDADDDRRRTHAAIAVVASALIDVCRAERELLRARAALREAVHCASSDEVDG